MRKYFFFLCLWSCILFAQGQAKTNTQNYYYWINQAELAACEEKWLYAAACYDSAFTYKLPHEVDLRAAYIVRLYYLKDKDSALSFAYELIKRGEEGCAESYIKTKDSDMDFYHNLLTIEDTATRCFNTELKNTLEQIFAKDQSFRHSWSNSATERQIDKTNMKAIRDVYRKYPAINEYTAGIYYHINITIPCLHFVQLGHYQLQPLLKKQVRLGNYPANMFMDMEGKAYHKKDKYGTTVFYRIGNTLFYYQPENIIKINKNRKKLGISETFEDYKKKVICQFKTPKLVTIMIQQEGYVSEIEMNSAIEQLKQEIDAEHATGNFSRMYYDRESSLNNK